MGYEVEIKYRVADPSALAAKLSAIGAKGGQDEHEFADLYLAHPSRDFALTGEALRLRKVGPFNAITYKGPRLEGPAKVREEIEIPFEMDAEAFDRLTALFHRIGFEGVALVSKTRREFGVERGGRTLLVMIDDAGDLGTFAEVEAIGAGDDDIAPATEAVADLGRELGLSEIEPRSYLRMTLERAGRRTV